MGLQFALAVAHLARLRPSPVRGRLRAWASELSRSYKRRAKRELGLSSVSAAHTGAVTFVQRFDSALRLNVHFHTLALDGVYVRDPSSGELRFAALLAPTVAQVLDVAKRTHARVCQLLRKSGRYLDDENAGSDAGDALTAEQPVLASCYQAAASGLDLLGPRAGRPTLRLLRSPPAQQSPTPELCADVRGVNVHAMVAFDGRDRPRLLRLCRYIARPPLAQERLSLLPDGRVHYEMKKKWRDGTHALVFDVLSFIGRLIALIPPPRFHMLRFHGVLAPHASLRGQVVPGKTAATQPQPAQLSLPHLSPVEALSSSGTPDDNAPKPPSRHPWACLLKHVFAVDVTVCVKCGGPMRLSAFATTPAAIARALARAGLGAQPPPCSPQTRVHEAQLRLAFG